MNYETFIVLGFAVIFTADFFMNIWAIRRRREFQRSALEDVNEKAQEMGVKFLKALKGEFDTIRESLERIEQKARLSAPVTGAVRVYGVLLQRGLETRLFVNPANTFEEIVSKASQEFGAGWYVMASAHAEVVAETPKKIEVKKDESSTSEFINNLKYCRDKFAESDAQKKTVDRIISNIEKHYGRSHSAS